MLRKDSLSGTFMESVEISTFKATCWEKEVFAIGERNDFQIYEIDEAVSSY